MDCNMECVCVCVWGGGGGGEARKSGTYRDQSAVPLLVFWHGRKLSSSSTSLALPLTMLSSDTCRTAGIADRVESHKRLRGDGTIQCQHRMKETVVVDEANEFTKQAHTAPIVTPILPMACLYFGESNTLCKCSS